MFYFDSSNSIQVQAKRKLWNNDGSEMGNEYAVYEVKKEDSYATTRAISQKNFRMNMKFWGVKCDKKTFFSKFTYRIRRKCYAFKHEDARLSQMYKNDIAFVKSFEYPDMFITSIHSLDETLSFENDFFDTTNNFAKSIWHGTESSAVKPCVLELPYLATGISVGQSVPSQLNYKHEFQNTLNKYKDVDNDLAKSVRFCVVEKFSSDESVKSALTALCEQSSMLGDTIAQSNIKGPCGSTLIMEGDVAEAYESNTSSNTVTDSELSLFINDVILTPYSKAPTCGFIDFVKARNSCSRFSESSVILDSKMNNEFTCEIDLHEADFTDTAHKHEDNDHVTSTRLGPSAAIKKMSEIDGLYVQAEYSEKSQRMSGGLNKSRSAQFIDHTHFSDSRSHSTYDILHNLSRPRSFNSLPAINLSNNMCSVKVELESVYSNVNSSCISLPLESSESPNKGNVSLDSMCNIDNVRVGENFRSLSKSYSLPDMSTNSLKWNYTLYELDKLISKIKHSQNFSYTELNNILLVNDGKITNCNSMGVPRHDHLSQAIENELRRINMLLRMNKVLISQASNKIRHAADFNAIQNNSDIHAFSYFRSQDKTSHKARTIPDIHQHSDEKNSTECFKCDDGISVRNRSFSLEDIDMYISHQTYKPKVITVEVSSSYNGIGAYVASNAETRRGHFIKMVENGSPSFFAGLKEGDCLIEINGRNVESLDFYDVIDMLKKSIARGRVQLLVVNYDNYALYKKQLLCPHNSSSVDENLQCTETSDKSNSVALLKSAVKAEEHNVKHYLKHIPKRRNIKSTSFASSTIANFRSSCLNPGSDSVVYEEPQMMPNANTYERLCDQVSVRHSVIMDSQIKEFDEKKIRSSNIAIRPTHISTNTKCSISPYFFNGTPI